jgi:ketosteroid isomerase-like protein
MTESHEAVARRFIDAFNARDLDAFVETLHPEIEIQSVRGPRIGIQEARDWATRKPGGVQQTVVIEEMKEEGARVLVLARRDWRWDGTDKLASSEELAFLFTFRDGKVARWQPFTDREEALAAAKLE